jgi:hypothetical protein
VKQKAGLFILLLFLGACSKVSDDRIPPRITAFELNSDTLLPGETLQVFIAGTDNENISQVRVQIKEAFYKSDFGFYEAREIIQISAGSLDRSLSFTIPDSSRAGIYSVAFQIIDERDNRSPDSLKFIRIGQTEFEPEILEFSTFPEINSEGTIDLAEGDTVVFQGSFADDAGLDECRILLRDEKNQNLRTLVWTVADSAQFYSLTQEPDTLFLDGLNPNRVPTELILFVNDIDGHQTSRVIPVNFVF